MTIAAGTAGMAMAVPLFAPPPPEKFFFCQPISQDSIEVTIEADPFSFF